MKKKMWKLTAFLLALLIAFNLLPATAGTVYAEDSDEPLYEADLSEEQGTDDLDLPESDLPEGDVTDTSVTDEEILSEEESMEELNTGIPFNTYTVWFGGKLWWVLDNTSNTIANDQTGQKGILLFSYYALGEPRQWRSELDDDTEPGEFRKRWDESDIRAYLQNGFEDSITMTNTEKNAVLTAVKNDVPDLYNAEEGCGLTGDRFFLLSNYEVEKYLPQKYLRVIYDETDLSVKPDWWTRSSSRSPSITTLYVYAQDGVHDRALLFCSYNAAVVPAFYLDPSKVESVTSGYGGYPALQFTDGSVSTCPKTITVTKEGNGTVNCVEAAIPGTLVSLEAVPAKGYRFKKWVPITNNFTVGDPESASTSFTIGYGNVEVKAIFERVTYNITYNLNGGSNNSANPSTYTVETDDITLTAPTKPGRVFEGWYDQGGNKVTTIPKGSAGDLTLRANWTIDAGTEARAFQLSPEVLGKNVNGSEHVQTVGYGGRDWQVIAYEDAGNEVLAEQDAAVLLCKYRNYYMVSYCTGTELLPYSESNMKRYTEAYLNGFGSGEIAALSERTLPGNCAKYGEEGYYPNGIFGEPVTTKIWPLSVAEVDALNKSIRTIGSLSNWTDFGLRTPGAPVNNMAFVDGYGDVYRDGQPATYYRNVRPAFSLKLNCIQYMSTYESEVSFDSTESNTLVPVGLNTLEEWRVTLKDDGSFEGLDGHQGFGLQSTHIDNSTNTLTVYYNGAATGDNEYISAIIKDNAGAVKYYGRLRNCTADENSSGSVTIALDGKFESGDKLYLFNEQYNGDSHAGLSSAFIEISIPMDYYTQNWSGQGTAEDPYIISDEEDWKALAGFMEYGYSTEETHFKLGSNISVTSMVGTAEHPFTGDFDGGSRTLTVTLTTSGEYTAPFCYVGASTFRNLRVKGTITVTKGQGVWSCRQGPWQLFHHELVSVP